jgi:hypothetical protein
MLSGETTNANFIVFCWTRPGRETTIYHTRGEHALLSEINAIFQNEFQNNENFTDLSEVDQLQLLMDNTIKVKPTKKNSASVARLEGISRKLMFKLHIKRTKLLESNRDNNEETDLTLRKGGGESRPGIAQESITINCDNCFRF